MKKLPDHIESAEIVNEPSTPWADIYEDKVWCEHCTRHDNCITRIDGITDILRCAEFMAVGSIRDCSNCRFHGEDQCAADPQMRKADFVGCRHWEVAPYLVWRSDREPYYCTSLAAEDECEALEKRGIEISWWRRDESGLPPSIERQLVAIRASGPPMSVLMRAAGLLP